jgi:hypothetical protein
MLLGILIAVSGCTAPSKKTAVAARPFSFQHDTFAYPNELVWEYRYDEQGRWTSRRREPPPTYYQHCFAVARTAKLFFEHARFDATQSPADEGTYRRLVRQVVSRNPRKLPVDSKRVTIPGYPDLRSLSQAHEKLLKQECGSALESYFQRGHWRIVFPFNRRHQDRTAQELVKRLQQRGAVVVHLVRFPQLTINHAVLMFDAESTAQGIDFAVYDPNQPAHPVTISYDRTSRTFYFPANHYFPGGRVDLQEVYRHLCN